MAMHSEKKKGGFPVGRAVLAWDILGHLCFAFPFDLPATPTTIVIQLTKSLAHELARITIIGRRN